LKEDTSAVATADECVRDKQRRREDAIGAVVGVGSLVAVVIYANYVGGLAGLVLNGAVAYAVVLVFLELVVAALLREEAVAVVEHPQTRRRQTRSRSPKAPVRERSPRSCKKVPE
jgi:NO-binding membrane sensor protein with MHYT domain